MTKTTIFPDYIIETSWEVCNKVGGIYTVLSTRAKTLKERLNDNLVFIGPDVYKDGECPCFTEDPTLFSRWRMSAEKEGLALKIGRWNIPGSPVAVLVDFTPFYKVKNEIYGKMWNLYGVDSLHAYGDYDEASMFSYAAGKVVESFYNNVINDPKSKVIFHGNEWMTGLGLLYIKHTLPQIATIFTTHATSIGRSIAGNNKALYAYMDGYNGDQMARELNMQSKHSIEKQTAHNVDCFTTVSEITDRECAKLLEKPADVVLPNGFDNAFVPVASKFGKARSAARERMLKVANALTGCRYSDDTLILSTSGRYEFRNKGIDVFIDAINRLRHSGCLDRQVLAFIEVPGWVKEPRTDLQERLKKGGAYDTPLDQPYLTHWLNDMSGDRILGMMSYLGMNNSENDNVKIIFVPCYLTGDDGIFDMSYYGLMPGNDLCIYPSYYEPWGYTPLEAIAFSVPCVTTDLSGFGLWVNSVLGHCGRIEDGVEVVHRTDDNYVNVAENIMETVARYALMSADEQKKVRTTAERLSHHALWSNFIKYYYEAYDFALRNAQKRNNR